ncbi:MAG TPA: glycoside hydrolase family 5 protein [Dictyoglomaceae bacterium]|nr:glycoside hydrolase family 5 protein [Dictyoglomaceae bacterium]
MKRLFLILVLFLLLLPIAGCTVESQKEIMDKISILEGVSMQRGVNMGNALEAPKEGEWGVVIKDEYFKLIKEAGFDHVRIPIKWSAHTEAKPPYKISEEFFDRVDHVINESLKQGLITIINIHHYDEIMQNPRGEKEKFLSIWRQISERYKDYPKTLFFEILNEPNGNLTPDIWNEFLAEALKVIRVTNPDRVVLVGTAEWGGISGISKLKIPKEEKNILVTVHYYNPFYFTHQGAEWASGSEQWLGTKWHGSWAEKQQVISDFNIAEEWSKENRRPIHIGEFGAYSKADMESRVRWTSFVAREAERRGWPWTYWEFCSGFGVYDPVKNEWRKELLEALIPIDK